jgi:hypothetical protein
MSEAGAGIQFAVNCALVTFVIGIVLALGIGIWIGVRLTG